MSRAAQAGSRVAVRRGDEKLVVEVSDGRLTDMDSLRDRIGALGGTLEHDPDGVRAVLPCA